MKSPFPVNKTQQDQLSPERRQQLDRRWLVYAVAAVGAAALNPAASAEVVFTRTNIILTNGITHIDLNQDGVTDFTFQNFLAGSSSSVRVIKVRGNGADANAAVIGRQNFFATAWPAPVNYAVGSGITKSFVDIEGQGAYLSNGITNRYLGLRFTISGQVHYGWIRFSVKGNFLQRTLTVTGYAYETQPDTAITTGNMGPSAKPSSLSPSQNPGAGPSLGLLSLGSVGLPAWRPAEVRVQDESISSRRNAP
jgi:hypothetical protein